MAEVGTQLGEKSDSWVQQSTLSFIEKLSNMSALPLFFHDKHSDSFHGSMQPLLFLGQVCGLVPVKGIFGPFLRFTWVNGVHVYASVLFMVTLFLDTCYTIDNLKMNIRIDVFASTVFYTVCLMTTLFFLQIAKELPKISESFAEVETEMSCYGYPKRLALKIKVFLFSFIFFAIVEHGALVFVNVKAAWASPGPEGFGHSFYVRHFPAITKRLPYSGLGTVILFWVNVMCTFNWNYTDFFIIVISMEIYSRFGQINALLQRNLFSENRLFWDKIRNDYNRMSLLTKTIDKNLSKLILTSFFSNMYHLSLQCIRSLKVHGSVFQVTYFYCSLTYLAMRLLLVLYFASKVNGESKQAVGPLLEVEEPCPEVTRLLHQVLTDEIALTGNQYFIINKKFFNSIIGTIVTYQAVLLQFNSLQENIHF